MFFLLMLKPLIIFTLILGFCLLLMFGWFNLIDRVFLLKQQLKPAALGWGFVFTAIPISTILAMFLIYGVTKTILNIPLNLEVKAPTEIQQPTAETKIVKNDCQAIISLIYEAQTSLEKSEDHRYIEDTSPIFSIDIEYQKNATKLQREAQIFSRAKVDSNSKSYTNIIAKKYSEKADLFRQRINVRDKQSVTNLLNEMDRVTEERLKIENEIKNQCGKYSNN